MSARLYFTLGISAAMLISLVGRRVLSSATEAGQIRTVFISVPSSEVGQRLGRSLVKNELAACVQIVGGVRSIYQWKGKIEEDNEELLIVKTRADLLDELKHMVLSLHPYDTPEILALPVTDGHDKYIKWLMDSTKKSIH